MDDFLEYLSNKLEGFDFKKLIFPTIIILLYIGGFVYLLTIIKKGNKEYINNSNNISLEVEDVSVDEIYIDIKGSVANPGVYKLNSDARVMDAIEASGGITADANTRFINLSKKLYDGDVIVIYSNKEIKEAQKEKVVYIDTPCVCEEVKNDACYKEEGEENKSNDKININTASLEELKTLAGIGEAKAKSIIDYRNNNGNFKSIEDIKKVNGISESIYAKIKENITI
ncbi:MAG: helix-hairpin-helix domain-containing protein [Bacilli bacterium]|nr:helix-hairpin-helix domain-containing protein [Bacilli bacterium]